MSFTTVVRRPSAFLPLLMSAFALSWVGIFVGRVGIVPATGQDESATARIFQLLLAAQLPVILYFAAAWLPRAPRPAAAVLALQCLAVVAAVSLVLVLER